MYFICHRVISILSVDLLKSVLRPITRTFLHWQAGLIYSYVDDSNKHQEVMDY